MRHLLQPLRIRCFRRLAAAYTVNGLGDWLGEIALAVLVLHATGSALAVAAVWVLGRFAPALVAPVLVARLEDAGRVALPALYAVEAALFAAILVVAAGPFSLPLLLLLACADGVVALAARALTKATIARATTSADCLREGNALLNAAFTFHCAAGPALAGVVVGLAGPQAALGLDALSFAAAALVLGWRADLPAATVQRAPIVQRLRDGVGHLRGNPTLRRLVAGEAATCVLFALVIPVEVVFVTATLGADESAYGLVLTAWGVGMILGGGLVPVLRRAPLPTVYLVGLVVMAASYLGMGAAASVAAVVAWSFVGGLGNGVEGFAVLTCVQERTPDALQARVGGLMESLHALCPGLGFLLGGILAATLGPRSAYLIAGAGAALIAVALAAALRERPAAAMAPASSPAT